MHARKRVRCWLHIIHQLILRDFILSATPSVRCWELGKSFSNIRPVNRYLRVGWRALVSQDDAERRRMFTLHLSLKMNL